MVPRNMPFPEMVTHDSDSEFERFVERRKVLNRMLQTLIDARSVAPGAPVSCPQCPEYYPKAVVSGTLTDAQGQFHFAHVPTGPNVPLLVQIGKWRRLPCPSSRGNRGLKPAVMHPEQSASPPSSSHEAHKTARSGIGIRSAAIETMVHYVADRGAVRSVQIQCTGAGAAQHENKTSIKNI